jgi:hypothetical protein
MNTRRIESHPFAGGSARAYQAARRELRQAAADIHGLPVSRVRIAPATVTLERQAGDRWIGYSKDIVDQHEWLLRHAPSSDTFRLVIRVRA